MPTINDTTSHNIISFVENGGLTGGNPFDIGHEIHGNVITCLYHGTQCTCIFVTNFRYQLQITRDNSVFLVVDLPDIHSGNGMLRKAAQRTAINAPMQGTAADIIKRAMIDIQNWLNEGSVDARMLLQVHDELVFEVSERDLPLLVDGVRFRMVSAAALDVPLVVDIGTGKNWDEAH